MPAGLDVADALVGEELLEIAALHALAPADVDEQLEEAARRRRPAAEPGAFTAAGSASARAWLGRR